MAQQVLLKVDNLSKYFELEKNTTLQAVSNVSFQIKKGETFGIVGESGCGKSTLGRTIIGLYKASNGQILYNDTNMENISEKDTFSFRRKMQMIFQDPYASKSSFYCARDFGRTFGNSWSVSYKGRKKCKDR